MGQRMRKNWLKEYLRWNWQEWIQSKLRLSSSSWNRRLKHNRTCNSTHIWPSSLPWWLTSQMDPAGFWSQVQVTKLGNSRFTEEITSPNLGRSHNLPHLDTKMTTLEGIAQRKMMSVHGYDTTYPSKGVSLFGKVPLLTFVNAISEKKNMSATCFLLPMFFRWLSSQLRWSLPRCHTKKQEK